MLHDVCSEVVFVLEVLITVDAVVISDRFVCSLMLSQSAGYVSHKFTLRTFVCLPSVFHCYMFLQRDADYIDAVYSVVISKSLVCSLMLSQSSGHISYKFTL